MTELAHQTHVKEIERIVEHLCEDWTNDKLENIERYYHPHAVAVIPGLSRKISGIEEIVENYRDFIEEAEVMEFNILDLLVDLFGTTAIAYFNYRIKYKVEGTTYTEGNTDVLVLRQHNSDWQIVWRMQLIGQ